MKQFVVLLTLLLLNSLAVVLCVYDCTGTPNNNPIHTDEPQLVKTTTNGKKYMVGKGDDSVYLIHVYGSPFDWGKATGMLLTVNSSYH